MTSLRVVFLTKIHPRPGAKEPGRDPGLVGRVVELVARDLLADELAIGLVLVVGVDDVVAIPPGILPDIVLLEPGRIGIAGHIHPVSAPALAVLRRGEQPLDQPLPRAAVGVGKKLVDLRESRWQPGQVESSAPQPRERVGRRPGHNTGLATRDIEKPVDRMLEGT